MIGEVHSPKGDGQNVAKSNQIHPAFFQQPGFLHLRTQSFGKKQIRKMNAYLKNHSAEIDSIAISLADHFAKPLYHFTDAKSYSEYIEILKEILGWSIEFYVQYHHKLSSWESFVRSHENIYNSADRDEFMIAWGRDKLKKFTNEYLDNEKYQNL